MTRISRLVVLGDSLSDRGTLDKRELLGFIPMGLLSGLYGKSPKGRFTNGYLWGDYYCSAVAEGFEIEHQRNKLKLQHTAAANADISDEFLTDIALLKRNETAFSLNDDKHILFNGERFARFYCEGGLTSYDYSTTITIDPSKEVSRLILSTLEKKRNALFADDKKYAISNAEKAATLIIEWSGANDLITVNERPTHTEVDNAVNERIKNIELSIQKGYRNFILFNLPDLGLTPRYQAKSQWERDNASECCDYFNRKLAERCAELNQKYKDLHIPINLYIDDINTDFKKIYDNPEQYGFDKSKQKTPFTSSEQFEKDKENPEYEKDKLSPADGYMFWDDVHPTEDMHNRLGEIFKEKFRSIFEFNPPQKTAKSCKEDYDILCKNSFFAEEKAKPIPRVKLPDDITQILDEMHEHAKEMCESSDAIRQKKGDLLKRLIFAFRSHNGNLEEIHEVISTFKLNTHAMKIIGTHQNPIYDFFVGKKTTRSEDTITLLENTVRAHLEPATKQMSI
ncbi:SGNH/GDSL hydrolase family protein [Legionella fallonii]|uniref:Putative Phosphatidylcholine--sterol O-acyltransferase n=1 Tax=Legionella fallonii LLAP-10 TaxID=1212491 RepID=A0A098G8T7_9GAMM|nr:SGNH/GDSL hydrolase family protein [Legionella fallonii]CEG57885.1 putative Phosphatidylcholine--sterol O-acyltransferase [Legionella fallonii LLAP-10]